MLFVCFIIENINAKIKIIDLIDPKNRHTFAKKFRAA
jgi:hypothetical protein